MTVDSRVVSSSWMTRSGLFSLTSQTDERPPLHSFLLPLPHALPILPPPLPLPHLPPLPPDGPCEPLPLVFLLPLDQPDLSPTSQATLLICRYTVTSRFWTVKKKNIFGCYFSSYPWLFLCFSSASGSALDQKTQNQLRKVSPSSSTGSSKVDDGMTEWLRVLEFCRDSGF